MSSTSADTDRLAAFGPAVGPTRAAAASDQPSLATDHAAVVAGCDNPVSVDGIAKLATLVEAMAANEKFVAAIHDALIAADVNGNTPVSDDVIALGLEAEGVGTPPPVIEVDPVTLVGIPPTSGYVDDPICAANGNMIHQETDLVFPAIAGALNIVRTYNSLTSDRRGAFGPGWSSLLDMRVDADGARADVTLGDGAAIPFVREHGGWSSTGRRGLELVQHDDPNGDSSWMLVTDHVRRFHFDAAGALTGWDVGVARVQVERTRSGVITAMRETVTGRTVTVAWADGMVSSIIADDGRRVDYTRDDESRIVRAESRSGWMRYEWDGDLLRSVVDPDGVAMFVNDYDEQRRVERQVSQFGRVTSYRYDASGSTIITGDDDGVRQAMIHDRRGNLTAVIDVDGSAMRFTYDSRDRMTKVVERDGATWAYEFDERDDLVRRVDPDGVVLEWEWDDLHRVVAETDRAGAVTRMEFDTALRSPNRVVTADGAQVSQILDDRGLPLEVTDADGVVTRFEWDTDGQLAATTDALGHTTTFDYDAHSLLVKLTKPAGVEMILERDAAGRVARKVAGDAVTTHEYTAAGRMRAGSEPGDIAWSATFGAHGAMSTVTDEAGSSVEFGYDELGNVTAVTAPDGATYSNTYSPVGLHVSSSDPTGATSVKGYDVRGRLTDFTDPEGNTWHRDFDVLGRTVASTSPDGGVTRWTHHPNGEVATVTIPDGRTWTTEIDQLGRPVAVVDPAGGRATLEYTPGGRVARRVSPAGRVEEFDYDEAGRLAVIVGIDGVRRFFDRDQRGYVSEVSDGRRRRGFEWDDDYRLVGVSTEDGTTSLRRDAGGRVVEAVDPTGATTRFGYDERGLLSEATDPAGLLSRYAYDERGRLSAQSMPGGRATSLEYGDDGRLERLTDPAGVVTDCVRNANGMVTGVRHGDGTGWDRDLDGFGAETARRAPDGTVLGEYSYDAAHRLVSSAVPGTDLFTEFLWDDNDRLVSTTTLDGGTEIERDADGWVVASTNPEGRRLEYERDALGRVVNVQFDGGDSVAVPTSGDHETDVAGRLTIGRDGALYRYDEAGRLVEIAPDGAASTSFTYSDDGLVATETGPEGTRRFGYDAAGRVVSVRLDGVGVTTIAYDLAGRRSREVAPDGAVTEYVWDTAGRLAAIDRDGPSSGRIEVVYDAIGRPAFVDGAPIGHDPVSGRVDRIGDDRFVTIGVERLDVSTGEWSRSDGSRPFGGVPVGPLFLLGARVLDPATHQFLSIDPLLAEAGSNGSASAYTYAWHDPINRVDPSGLRPISIEEADAMRTREEQGRMGQFVEAIKDDPWGTVAMVGVAAVGVALIATGAGAVVGAGILIGVGSSMAVGYATGTFSPTGAAVSGAFGALPGGATLGGAVVLGAASGVAETVTTSVLTGDGMPSGGQLALGAVTGSGSGALNFGVGRLLTRSGTPDLDHTPTPTVAETPSAVASSRLPQDLAVNPTAPEPLPTNRPIGQSPTQNQHLQDRIGQLRAAGADDIRVNQQQVDIDGVRVGINRPDLQYTQGGVRRYEEFDTGASRRGPGHQERIEANDPNGTVELFTVD
ncbi:DUF6531 domain-containing protein [Ilumatobacter nonamiensis]|uniref:DUF6531 domain-containing protein n=1 Tax=Ilumatobacter nonamiensis TaxID=467093 RepID=UPI00034661ED|nr:DUF6531 domain-containing protein [Ilumatobacter nonamiensis]